MPTRVLCHWAEKTSRLEVEIDANDRVIVLRRVGPGSGTATISRPDGTRVNTLARGQTEVAVGTTVALRIQLTFDAARNRWDGLAGQAQTEG